MMIRRVWIKTIGDNASIAITDHGKRRGTLPNSSTGAPPRPLQRADNGPLCALLLRRSQAFLRTVLGRTTPYKDPARDGLHRLKKPGASERFAASLAPLFFFRRPTRALPRLPKTGCGFLQAAIAWPCALGDKLQQAAFYLGSN